MNLKKIMNDTFFDKKPLSRKDYKESRELFVYQGVTSMAVFSLTSGAFLAGLANYMGASDEYNGIIGAIPSLVCVVQIFAPLVFEKLNGCKLLASTLSFWYRFLLGLIFLIPFFIKSQQIRLSALAILYGTAYALASFITPSSSNWIVSLVPEDMRGKYFAHKDAISLMVVTLITLLTGKIMDVLKNNHFEIKGFIATSIIVTILTILDFIFLTRIKEPILNRPKPEIKLKDVIITPLKNKMFTKIIMLFIIWNIALQIAAPFFSVYMVTRLKLSYTYIMAVGIIASASRALILPYWGKLADRTSWETCTKYSIATLALTHFLWMFVNNSTMYFIVPILHVIGGIAWGGIGIGMFNIQFAFSPQEGRTLYLALNAAIGGIIGFLSTILGSKLLKIFEPVKLNLFSINISNMQLLFGISGTLLFLCALFIKLFVNSKKVEV